MADDDARREAELRRRGNALNAERARLLAQIQRLAGEQLLLGTEEARLKMVAEGLRRDQNQNKAELTKEQQARLTMRAAQLRTDQDKLNQDKAKLRRNKQDLDREMTELERKVQELSRDVDRYTR